MPAVAGTHTREPGTLRLPGGGSSTCALAHLLNMTFPYACMMTRTQFTGVTVVRLGDEPGSLTMPHFEILSDARHILFAPEGLEKD